VQLFEKRITASVLKLVSLPTEFNNFPPQYGNAFFLGVAITGGRLLTDNFLLLLGVFVFAGTFSMFNLIPVSTFLRCRVEKYGRYLSYFDRNPFLQADNSMYAV